MDFTEPMSFIIADSGSHAINHWFLTVRIKLQGGKHQVIILDSLGNESGNGYLRKLKGKLQQMKLTTKKDKYMVFDTKNQTEAECGVRMAAYMALFRSMDIQKMKDGQIIQKIKGQVAREKGFSGDLAAHRRRHIYTILQNEQAKVRK